MGEWRYSSKILDICIRREVSGQLQVLAAFPRRELSPIPFGQMVGWAI
jgi:hypothetical protein